MYPHSLRIWALSQFIWIATVAGAPSTSWTAEPFNPPAFPLAVRTPYLSCWLAQGNQTALNEAWPTFWTGSVRELFGSVPSFGRIAYKEFKGTWLGWVCESGWCGIHLSRLSYRYRRNSRYSKMVYSKVAIIVFYNCADLLQFTSTQSVFVLQAGGIDLTATFLSPVQVSDPSLMYAYC
jgi:hypothetical protein